MASKIVRVRERKKGDASVEVRDREGPWGAGKFSCILFVL